MSEQHIACNEEDQGTGKVNAELLINYENIETVEQQLIVELMKKYYLQNPQNLRKPDLMRFKDKTKLLGEFIDPLETSKIAKDIKLVKCGTLVITQLLGIKET